MKRCPVGRADLVCLLRKLDSAALSTAARMLGYDPVETVPAHPAPEGASSLQRPQAVELELD